MATKVKFGTEISLSEAANTIMAVGPEVCFMLEGEPGIGKSSLLKLMKEKYKDAYTYSYMDCTTLDLGDIAMPKVEKEGEEVQETEVKNKEGDIVGIRKKVVKEGMWVTHYAPNARFRLQDKKKVVIMLDEITKAPEPVKNMLLPLIQERRLGDVYLPEGSIVFATGNLTTDGVGDTLKAHARNRVTVVKVKKPRAFQTSASGDLEMGEWGLWAMNNGVAAEIIAWTKDYPQAMASYTDSSQGENPYIYHPQKQQLAFVSPRSLEKASAIVKNRNALGPDVTIATLAGTIGEAAARDLQAYTALADKLAGFDQIVADPKKAPIPDNPAAMCMIVFNCVMNVEKQNMDKVMDYITRMKKEAQALFALSIIKSTTKQALAMSNKKFTDFAVANQYLFG